MQAAACSRRSLAGRQARSALAPARTCAAPPMTSPSRLQRAFGALVKLIVTGYLLAIVAAIVVYKAAFVGALLDDPFFAAYGLAVSAYLVSLVVLSLPYRVPSDEGLEPGVQILIASLNTDTSMSAAPGHLPCVQSPAA